MQVNMRKIKSYIILLVFNLLAAPAVMAQNKTVTLDCFFNNEYRKNSAGTLERYHYTWEDQRSSGYSIWSDIFKKNGTSLKSLESEPDAQNLTGTDIYIIVDPDTKKETTNPNYIEARHIKAIADWVKRGGVLVLMANDSANAELPHLNKLAEKFGIHFNDDLYKHVIGTEFEMGAITVPADDPVFKTAKKLYLKDIATLTLSPPATPLLVDSSKVIIGTAKYGAGTVIAVGDPWLYNEYTNGRLPAAMGVDNDKAADDLSKWLLSKIPVKIKQ
jgi:unsaturated rhamnogalacturonyl hydrolase